MPIYYGHMNVNVFYFVDDTIYILRDTLSCERVALCPPSTRGVKLAQNRWGRLSAFFDDPP